MSGGEYSYFFQKLRQFSEDILYTDINPARWRFAYLMKKAADVAYEIEWADSGDTDQVQATESILNFLEIARGDGVLLSADKARKYDHLMNYLDKIQKGESNE